jgi:hypothetical protein
MKNRSRQFNRKERKEGFPNCSGGFETRLLGSEHELQIAKPTANN